jgi:hypothetical protein
VDHDLPGLAALPLGPVLPPVRSLPAERREWLVDQLRMLGIA